jgi:hypothetical protein
LFMKNETRMVRSRSYPRRSQGQTRYNSTLPSKESDSRVLGWPF